MNSFGRRSRAVVIFTALLILIVNLTWWLFYSRIENSFEQQLSRRLSSIARLGSAEFDPEAVGGLLQGYLWAYDEALGILENIREADSLSEVFILDDSYNYLATTSPDEESAYYLASLNRTAIESAFQHNKGEIEAPFASHPAVTADYRSGDLILKSAFAPLYDTTGIVMAVLGVEADVDYADDLLSLRRSLYVSTGISVGIGVLFGLLFFAVQKRISATEQSIFLSQSQANLGRMVAVVSHEIRNPLMIIRASAESLRKKLNSAETEFILEEIDRLNQIVSGYLDFASGKLALEKKAIDVGNLLVTIVEKFDVQLKKGSLQLRPETPDGNIFAIADPVALRQVIINLLLNAAEAVADSDEGQVIVYLTKPNNKVVIEIEDNGPGIKSNEVRNIFEPFYTTKTSGSGLGLFLSRRLIEEMGGTIKVDSKIDGPTRFILSLSAADNRQ